MTDLSTLDRALATLRAWPHLAGGLEELADALLLIEAAASASPAADGGRLHLRLMDRLCAWIRRISPAASARRFPLMRAAHLVQPGPSGRDPDIAALQLAFHRARHFGLHDQDDTNLRNWLESVPPAVPGLQLALDVLRRRSPAQLEVERTFQPWQQQPEIHVAGAEGEGEGEWRPDPEAVAWWPDLSDTNLQLCDLSRMSLRRAEFYGAHLQGATLEGADLRGARLVGARLDCAWLTGACLVGADLCLATAERCTLNYADLRGANLASASLNCAAMHEADLTGADLGCAILTDAYLDNWPRIQSAQLRALRAQAHKTRSLDLTLGLIAPRPLPPLFTEAELERVWRQGAEVGFCVEHADEDEAG